MTRARPTLAAPEDAPALDAGIARSAPHTAQTPSVAGLLLARAWRGEFVLLALVAFFIEGWWLAPTGRLSWTASQRAVDFVLLIQWLLAVALWPAVAGPVIAERFERFGHLPIPLASARRWTAAWVDLLGQCALVAPLLLWASVLWPAQPRMVALLQCAAVLGVLGLEAGAWWRVGRRFWGASTLRPGLWLIVAQLLGLTLILVDPMGDMARELGGSSGLGRAWQVVDPLLRTNWIPWLIDSLQQRWSWQQHPLAPALELQHWMSLHLAWTALLWALSVVEFPKNETEV